MGFEQISKAPFNHKATRRPTGLLMDRVDQVRSIDTSNALIPLIWTSPCLEHQRGHESHSSKEEVLDASFVLRPSKCDNKFVSQSLNQLIAHHRHSHSSTVANALQLPYFSCTIHGETQHQVKRFRDLTLSCPSLQCGVMSETIVL
jgi:hypothetical protein